MSPYKLERLIEIIVKDVKGVDPYAVYCMGEYDTESGIKSTDLSFVADCAELVKNHEEC